MEKVILIGTGGHAAEVREYIHYHNRLKPNQAFELLGFIDVNNENEMNEMLKFFDGKPFNHMILHANCKK